MIAFTRMSVYDQIRRAVSPSFRRKQDESLEASIRKLMEHPELPCAIDGMVVPDGYGSEPIPLSFLFK